ncbi:MAG TPA: sulfatase, partial [Thermomicrobiales bacterium]|nr:sulfatase [Thermomicrobiales bacterium]
AVPSRAAPRPNIILILTDDLDSQSIAAMPALQSLLVKQGTLFSRFFVSMPLCAPSRASILRGQYPHNHGVLNNTGVNGGFPAFFDFGDEASTVATWLHDAGYRTGLFGKYLNRYPKEAPRTYVPPGWDAWFGLMEGGANYYLDFTLNENGTPVAYGGKPEDYLTDVLADKAAAFIGSGGDQALFAYIAPYAPHAPSTPPPRYANAFADVKAPRGPAFNEADVSDKPAWLRASPLLTPNQIDRIDQHYRDRLRSLLAVDDLLRKLVDLLQAQGRLADTCIAFTSDNGFQLGEHRLPLGKQTAYEESIRVPLIVRGPGVPQGKTVDQLTLNSDLAPTFAAWAAASAPDFVDGRSLLPLFDETPPAGWRDAILIEDEPVIRFQRAAPAHATPVATPIATPIATPGAADDEDTSKISPAEPPPYNAIRTTRYLYVAYDDGEREVYDLQTDPAELTNVAATTAPALLAAFADRLEALRTCRAGSCRAAEDAPFPSPD